MLTSEALTETVFGEKDRYNFRAFMSVLRRKLSTLSGNWLLCIGNADQPSVTSILDEMANLGSSENGWALVTSRQGGKTLWNGMCLSQKLEI